MDYYRLHNKLTNQISTRHVSLPDYLSPLLKEVYIRKEERYL